MNRIIEVIKEKLFPSCNDARRLFHGRGWTYEGLNFINIDAFPPLVLITLYQEPEEQWLADLVHAIISLLKEQGQVQGLMIQRRHLQGAPRQMLWGVKPEGLVITENGLHYEVRLSEAQNNGFFLDMILGREWVRQNAEGKHVLNLFAYSCSFSVAALAGGARSVINVDMNRRILEQGRNNHRLNNLNLKAVEFFAHNIFKSWGKLKRKGPYDLLILDPPYFQKGSFSMEKDYAKLIRRIPELLRPRGLILATLNSPSKESQDLIDLFTENCSACVLRERLPNPPDFPEKFPERNLKVMQFHYLPAALGGSEG